MLRYYAEKKLIGNTYLIRFPDFSGVFGFCKPSEDHQAAAQKMLLDSIYLSLIDGEGVPRPTGLPELKTRQNESDFEFFEVVVSDLVVNSDSILNRKYAQNFALEMRRLRFKVKEIKKEKENVIDFSASHLLQNVKFFRHLGKASAGVKDLVKAFVACDFDFNKYGEYLDEKGRKNSGDLMKPGRGSAKNSSSFADPVSDEKNCSPCSVAL